MTKIVDGVVREHAPALEKLLNGSADIIDETLLYGMYIIDAIIDREGETKDISTKVSLLMLRDMLEAVDSIGVLVKQGCSFGTIPLMRTVFEIYLSIIFLLNDTSGKRAVVYDVCHIHRKIDAGKSLKCQGDDVDARIKLLEAKLNEAEYKTVNVKWEKYVKNNGHPPNFWFEITEEPHRSIRQLAKAIGKLNLYDALYGFFSAYSHGSMALINNDYQYERITISSLRRPRMVSHTNQYCLDLASEVYYLFIKKYLNDSDEQNADIWRFERQQQIRQLVEDEKVINHREAKE